MSRTPLALALVVVVCGCSDRPARPAEFATPANAAPQGYDPLALRIPRGGGNAAVYRYAALDSAPLWQSDAPVAPIDSVLAFDPDAGMLALIDSRRRPVRIDLRAGTVATAAQTPLTDLSSVDGWSIYGIAKGGSVVRLTPTGDWSFEPPEPATELFPQSGGALVIASESGEGLSLWRVIPPYTTVLGTAELPAVERATRTSVGDRVYFTIDSGVIGVRSRDLEPIPSIAFEEPVLALAPTPSGDPVYALTDSGRTVAVIDRYAEEVSARLALPGRATALRMDPLGRYVLAGAPGADTAWVIDVGSSEIIGAVATAWRSDLPAVTPVGTIATTRRNDVVFLDPRTLQAVRTIARGAADRWYFFAWNGFVPRAAGLDEPVHFDGVATDSTGLDSTFLIAPDTTPVAPETTAVAPIEPPAAERRPPARGYTVSFAALLNEQAARDLASEIAVEEVRARVVPTQRGDAVIYRVVLGPYATRGEADRIGQASGRNFWIFEGTP